MSRTGDTHVAPEGFYHYCLRDSFLREGKGEGFSPTPRAGRTARKTPPPLLFLTDQANQGKHVTRYRLLGIDSLVIGPCRSTLRICQLFAPIQFRPLNDDAIQEPSCPLLHPYEIVFRGTCHAFRAHRAAFAFLAIFRRFAGLNFAARASPPILPMAAICSGFSFLPRARPPKRPASEVSIGSVLHRYGTIFSCKAQTKLDMGSAR